MDPSVKKTILNEYLLGDMSVIFYLVEDNRQVEMLLIPADMREQIVETKFSRGDSLVQIKLLGDVYSGSYAGGETMRNSETVNNYFKYENQSVEQKSMQIRIITTLQDERGYRLQHHIVYHKGENGIMVYTVFENQSSQKAVLEMLSSFSMTEITPFQRGDASECLKLHRILSKWSAEGRLRTDSIEDLQLEPNWVEWQPRSVRFGAVGSMPVKGYFPFVAVEDTSADVTWGAQLGIESSWQIEAYRRDEGLAISGGIADREMGQWMKEIAPWERFTTPWAILTVGHGGVDTISQRMTQCLNRFVDEGPASEQELPILFNEYCTTWGLPSHENIAEIVRAISNRGISYFVIDCGWFVEEGKHWGESMGDYIPSDKLFPNTMQETVDLIKENGMQAGLWFEIDNVGKEAHAYRDEEHLLKRDGYVLTTGNRRFWDMRQKWVQDYLSEKVIGQLKQYGFTYMKMDYNDTIGIGCDGSESIGEGLRANMESSVAFVQKVKEEIPGIVLENCASGGHKLEPLMMSLCSMASFSDAHECEEIPVIAANLHRTILPRQSQIWAVIRKEADAKRIAYVMSSTFLGRMCLSGDVTQLSEMQWKVITDGIDFYQKLVPVIKDGFTYFHVEKRPSDRHLNGYQGIVRIGRDGKQAYVVIHTFHGELPQSIEITLPKGCPETIREIYSYRHEDIRIENHILYFNNPENMLGTGILLG